MAWEANSERLRVRLPCRGVPGRRLALRTSLSPVNGYESSVVPCPIRILVPSLRGTGGIATYTVSLAKGLASAGHEVVLLDETGSFETSDPRITTVGLRAPKKLVYPLQPMAEWGLRSEVRRLARKFHVDGIHATRVGFVPRGERSVITVWDPITSPIGRFRAASHRGEPRAMEAMHALVDTAAARRSGAIVAVTQEAREGFDRFGRCEFVPPFLEDGLIVPSRSHRSHDIVMVAGFLDLQRKDLGLALQAVSLLRETVSDTRLILVGDWIDPGRADTLPDFCEARGRLDPADLQAAFAVAGCCLISSRWEEFGYSGLEALAAGIPVASTPLPGYEGLSGGGVFMAGTREPADLAREIAGALDATTFEFPAECRASVAIPRILGLYESTFGPPSGSTRLQEETPAH
jgi:glycosyltransferase involved in cell wall biosynthesis